MKGTRVVVYNSNAARNLPFPSPQLTLLPTTTTVATTVSQTTHPISLVFGETE